jgi:tetratricopeptide (TPR) repeat protein
LNPKIMTKHCQLIIPILLSLSIYAEHAMADDYCRQLAARARTAIDIANLSMEPEDSLALLRREIETVLRTDCHDSPEAAYIDLRMQELGAGASFPVGILSQEQKNALAVQASAYRTRFPDSAPIATVFARTSHTVEAAQAAIHLDAHYQPAQVALAEALLLAGRLDEAQAALRQIPDLSVVSDGYSLQARILLSRGDLRGAILAANRALYNRQTMLLREPDGASVLPLRQANEVLGLAHLQRKEYKAAARALIKARASSEQTEALLRNPPDGLEQALHALHFKPD